MNRAKTTLKLASVAAALNARGIHPRKLARADGNTAVKGTSRAMTQVALLHGSERESVVLRRDVGGRSFQRVFLVSFKRVLARSMSA